MNVTLKESKENLEHIVRDSPTGIGWYGGELRCQIPRSDHPDGMNVWVLEAMTDAGTLIKASVDGNQRWFDAAAEPSSNVITHSLPQPERSLSHVL
jgi:hypothetical protein